MSLFYFVIVTGIMETLGFRTWKITREPKFDPSRSNVTSGESLLLDRIFMMNFYSKIIEEEIAIKKKELKQKWKRFIRNVDTAVLYYVMDTLLKVFSVCMSQCNVILVIRWPISFPLFISLDGKLWHIIFSPEFFVMEQEDIYC
jgi:hypothetical protein